MRVAVLALALLLAACATRAEMAVGGLDPSLRMNDIQAIGTHNSYKQAIGAAEFAALSANNPLAARTLDYAHPPLSAQLDAGARVIELDVLYDPEGGRYAEPAMRRLLPAGTPLEPYDASAMRAPGYKVLHAQDLDYRSSCATFVACLSELRDWSAQHPSHAPVLVMINWKRGASPVPGGVAGLEYDAAAFDALDAEVRSVISARALITPDEVQGTHATLREGVLAGGWPALEASRGRFFFALDEGEQVAAAYRGARRNLEGRVFFVNVREDSPVAAYLTLNDPVAQGERIRAAVTAGFIVRTRADADTWEARRGDTARREAAFASGAQYVSTDYMSARAEWSSYAVTMPEVARCNPVRAAGKCNGLAIEAR